LEVDLEKESVRLVEELFVGFAMLEGAKKAFIGLDNWNVAKWGCLDKIHCLRTLASSYAMAALISAMK